MTDARWIAIEDDFQAACTHFSGAARLFDAGGFDESGIEGYKASMAFMHAMQSGHTSLESGLLRILTLLGEEHPQGPFWHRDLLRQVCRPVEGRGVLLPPDVCKHADETRGFRNVATRSYDSFEVAGADVAVGSAAVLAERLVDCLRDLRDQIDPPEDDGGGDGSGGFVRSVPRSNSSP